MTKIKKGARMFQGGGAIVDEDTLFDDVTIANENGDAGLPAEPGAAGALAGELLDQPDVVDLGKIGPDGGGAVTEDIDDEPGAEAGEAPAGDLDIDNVELTGVELFLSNYGVNGGIISYEDGSSARFSDLGAEEQNTLLSSLINEGTPSIEEKYNLDDGEVNLLNAIRESDQSPEEFINNVIDHRLQTLSAKQQTQSIDYEGATDDAIYVNHLMSVKPEITDDEIAAELEKAKSLATFADITEGIRSNYIAQQEYASGLEADKNDAIFNEELEAQRFEVVQSVENINDIAGAAITPEMKEFLLQDIMELNENKDPVLMEKVFGDPESMFKTNWFLSYGEDYINNLNAYWRTQVSKAHKAAYNQVTNGMPSNPTIISPSGTVSGRSSGAPVPQIGDFGRVLTEEELFEKSKEE